MISVVRSFVDAHGLQLHYYDNQSAEDVTPLVCFHMSPYSGLVYEPFLEILKDRRRAIAIDTPGFGNSEAPRSQPAITDYANALGEGIERLDMSKVHLMGYHTGSLIAAELANQRPDLVGRIVLVSAPIWLPDERAGNPLAEPRSIQEDGSDVAAMWREAVRWSMPGRTLEMIARIFPERLVNPDRIHWGHVAAHGYDLAQGLGTLRHRVLVLNPNDDLQLQTRRADPYLKHRNSRIQELPAYGHGFLDVRTSESAALVEDFLRE